MWRIDAGARNVVCPSPACEQVLSGFTSIIDVAFGSGGPCEIIEADLDLPSAITFDKRGDLWVLENNIGLPFVGSGAPTVRRLN